MNKIDPVTHEIFMQIAWTLTWVEDILGSREKAFLWLETENPNFCCTPLSLILRNRGHKVLKFIEAVFIYERWNKQWMGVK